MRKVSLLVGVAGCVLMGAGARAQTDGEPDYGALFGIPHGPDDGYFAVANEQTVEVFHVNVTELPEAFEGEAFDDYIRRNADLRGVWQPIRRVPMEWRFSVMNQGFAAQDSPLHADGFKGRGTFDPTPDDLGIDWSGDEFEIIAAATTYTWDADIPGATVFELVAIQPPSHQAERIVALYSEPVGAGSPCYAQTNEGDTTGVRPRPDASPPGDCFIIAGESAVDTGNPPSGSPLRPTAKPDPLYTSSTSPASCGRNLRSCKSSAYSRYLARLSACLGGTTLCMAGGAATCFGAAAVAPPLAPACFGAVEPLCSAYGVFCGGEAMFNFFADEEKCIGAYNCCMDSECDPAGEP